MKANGLVLPLVEVLRRADTGWQRRMWPRSRQVVFDARTAMEYGMMAPVHRRLLEDSRLRCWLMSSERPHQVADIFRDAPPGAGVVSPRAALVRRFDAYIAADLVWARLPRGTRRVQMFHGVAGKWHRVYDRPETSMRQWDRLFFINRKRLQNYIASGAVESGSPAVRLVGMPKSDCLVDGSLNRDAILAANGLDPTRPTVLYAPTWSRFSSLNAMGEAIVRGLLDAGHNVLVKLHENSFDPALFFSGGQDWAARLQPLLPRGRGLLIRCSDASPWLVAADILITDHSSIGFEYLLLDRPLVRIAMPQLIAGTDIAPDYVDLMAMVATTVDTPAGVVSAVDEAMANPTHRSSARRAVAAELFHNRGRATECALHELYSLMELDLPVSLGPVVCATSVGANECSIAQ
jgi:CDP-Glycerol:Poly(glycerophosphate) glycerophosphotransferase